MTYNESRYASMEKYRDSTREKYNPYQKKNNGEISKWQS